MDTSHLPPSDSGIEARLRAACGRIKKARRTIALTGAGLSAESGVPPFRRGLSGMPGLWERFDPMEYGTIDAFVRDPARVWLMLREIGRSLQSARPSAGHQALARLENEGLLATVITQNIDGLHQRAGSRRVLEFHGTWRTMTCLACRGRVESDAVSLAALPPLCRCGGVLKPDVTLFGEIIPSRVIDAAYEEARSCDCLLVVGTSAEVMPAATIPEAAHDAGAFIIEINVEETALTPLVTDLHLTGPAGPILTKLAERSCPRRAN